MCKEFAPTERRGAQPVLFVPIDESQRADAVGHNLAAVDGVAEREVAFFLMSEHNLVVRPVGQFAEVVELSGEAVQ